MTTSSETASQPARKFDTSGYVDWGFAKAIFWLFGIK